MPTFSPDAIAAWAGGRWTAPPRSPITGFTMDTRTLTPGQTFVALRTGKRDGHDFLPEAERSEAPAAIVAAADPRSGLAQLVVSDPLTAFQAIARGHRREFSGPVIGISGSAGKTSTKDLLARLLGGADAAGAPVLATEKNLNNQIGVPLTLTRLDPAIHHFAVVEAGIGGPGEMAPLAEMIDPDVAIITLVAPAHLAGLGGLDGVAREKAELAARVRKNGLAIFPSSCALLEPFRRLKVSTRVAAPMGASLPADLAGDRILFRVEHRDSGTTLTLGGPPSLDFELPRVSDGMAQNAALALCAALSLGLTAEDLRPRLGGWRPAPLRGEWRRIAGRMVYLDCYNANPASMADALAAFAAAAPDREPRLYIIGCMEELGAESERYHRELGLSLKLRDRDFLCIIGPQGGSVRAGALVAGASPDQIGVADSIEPAVARMAMFRGAVFVKGSRRYALERLVGEGAHA